MRETQPLSVVARQAAWDRLWQILLAPPARIERAKRQSGDDQALEPFPPHRSREEGSA
jgi:hypothetical protein